MATIESNPAICISEKEQQPIDAFIQAFNIVSRIVYQSFYIIDHGKKTFLYVSDDPLFLCGHTVEEVREMGYSFFLHHVPEDELGMLAEIEAAGIGFFEKLPVHEKMNCILTFDSHFIVKGRKILVNYKFTPVWLTDEGKVRWVACAISLPSKSKRGNVIARIAGQPAFWTYSLKRHLWKKNEEIILNDREIDILALSAQGYTMDDIAGKLYLSPDTIKSCKRKLFNRMQVRSITEALSFVINYKLL